MSKLNIQPVEDFNWEEFEQGTSSCAVTRSEQEAAYDATLTNVKEGEVTVGKVSAISKREVVVNIGFKSEGTISASEFRYNPDLKVGDEVEVFVESQEDKKGQLVLSHRKARAARSWDLITEALEKDEIVKGYVKSRTKGGMIVDVFGIEAFLPGSQIDVRPIRDYDAYVDKTMEFKIVKINNEFKNVVVSHKVLIEAELEAQKAEIIGKLEKGQILEGVVKNITSYGVFIDLGGVDGLIHITDLSWTKKIKHPSEFVNTGDKIEVMVLELDAEGHKLSLGHKQTTPNPWDKYEAEFAVGTIHTGTVSKLVDKGATVPFNDDILAFVPTRHLEKEDGKKLGKGETAEFKIIEFNKEFKRVVASHTAIFKEEEEKIAKEAANNTVSAPVEKSTLGDLEALQELKDKMEKEK